MGVQNRFAVLALFFGVPALWVAVAAAAAAAETARLSGEIVDGVEVERTAPASNHPGTGGAGSPNAGTQDSAKGGLPETRLDPTEPYSPPASVADFSGPSQALVAFEFGEVEGARAGLLVELDPKERQIALEWRAHVPGNEERGRRARSAWNGRVPGPPIAVRFWPTAACAMEGGGLVVGGVDRYGNVVLEHWSFSPPSRQGDELLPGQRTRVDEWFTGYLEGDGAIRGLWWMPERGDRSVLALMHGSRMVYRFDAIQELFTPMITPELPADSNRADSNPANSEKQAPLPWMAELQLPWTSFGRVLDRGSEGVFYLLERRLERRAPAEDPPMAYFSDHDRDGFIDRGRPILAEELDGADWLESGVQAVLRELEFTGG